MPLHPNAWFKLQDKVGSSFVFIKRGEVFHRGQVAASSADSGREGSGFAARVFLMKEAGPGMCSSALASHFTAEVFKNF